MSGPDKYRPLRRFTSQNTRLAIVIAVPLAASCLLGAPLSFVSPASAPSSSAETTATVPERQRRAVELAVQQPAPHDPPHRIAPWSGDKTSADDQANALAASASRVLHAAARPGIPRSFRLPQTCTHRATDPRGPPAAGKMGC
ncbi:MAG: hypothetical protein PWP23_2016 [Candidatus Sumerlaeota bacterium]|nr:hypothetical protein [Candidatus Sumerlaeota bacterium]